MNHGKIIVWTFIKLRVITTKLTKLNGYDNKS